MGRSGVTLIISVALLVLVAESFAAVSYRVNDGTDQDINEFSVCKNVDNASGHDLFVATKSIQEWFAFIAGPPGGTTLTACGATPPDAIADLTYAGRTNASVSLTWTAPADNGTAIIDYLVEYKLTADSTWTVFVDGLSTTTAVTVTGLTASTSYDFRVAALNGSQGAYSNVVTQDTAPNDPFFNPGVYNAMNCGGATTSTVVAMDDNTNIQLNGSTLTGSPINAHAVITFASALGDIISADKPVFVGGSLVLGGGDAGKGNIVWNTPYWAGKDFI
ncbi:MAG: fibronectin type III domain-containing protein, partial [Bdellovibrionales bacterium]